MGKISFVAEDFQTISLMAAQIYVADTANMSMSNRDLLCTENTREAAKTALALFLAVCDRMVAYAEDPTDER
jgi:hypothetical protein